MGINSDPKPRPTIAMLIFFIKSRIRVLKM
jgi:hypothetical protein